jgi:OmpA-OmpF porin, OOP family
MVIDGATTVIAYRAAPETAARSVAQFFNDNLAEAGFETLFACTHAECLSGGNNFNRLAAVIQSRPFDVGDLDSKQMFYRLARLARPDSDVFVSVLVGHGARGPAITLRVVETRPRPLDKSALLDADAMNTNIESNGKAVLYGIFFEAGKADIMPQSQDNLSEIARFLTENPKVKLVITGHTDNRGDFQRNIELSKRRADAVVAALVGQHGIAAERLTAFGAGMTAPVASNDDTAGRQKNRRVELVKQ